MVCYFSTGHKPVLLDSGDSPKSTSFEPKLDIRDLTPWAPYSMDNVEEYLRMRQQSTAIGASSGLLRLDIAQAESNMPAEDTVNVLAVTEDHETHWFLVGTYDGHWGCETASILQSYLGQYIFREMERAYQRHFPNSESAWYKDMPAGLIDQAVKDAFISLDRAIIDGGASAAVGDRFLNDAMSELAPSYSGSCALVSLYEHKTNLLRVACTGDSRAVLGRRKPDGKWEALVLSVDQNGYNSDEVARIQSEHPNEPDVIREGRLLGLAVTRAFGDGLWKWSREVQQAAQQRFFGRRPRPGLRTPPYLTAEPIITTTKVCPEKGDFLILATDGLWDNLSNEQAVSLVGQWLQRHDPSNEANPPPTPLVDVREYDWQREGIERDAKTRGKPEPQKSYTGTRPADPKHFVVKDNNAAAHLVRNALGGGNEDLLRGLLTVPPPFSRNLRDDISVSVLFFGEQDAAIDTFDPVNF